MSAPPDFIQARSSRISAKTSALAALLATSALLLGQSDASAESVASATTASGAATKIASGDFYAPRFSPDGEKILVTGERYKGLRELNLQGKLSRTISTDDAAGVKARYLDDGRVQFDARVAGAERSLIASEGKLKEAAPAKPKAFAHGNNIYLRTEAGIARVSTGADHFAAPQLSPDGDKLVYMGASTGLYVFDLRTGTTEHVGAGTYPQWSPDSASLVYEKTLDDGHALISSDIWVWSASKGERQVTSGDALLERRPAWSPDGTSIVFDDDRGSIYLLGLADRFTEAK